MGRARLAPQPLPSTVQACPGCRSTCRVVPSEGHEPAQVRRGVADQDRRRAIVIDHEHDLDLTGEASARTARELRIQLERWLRSAGAVSPQVAEDIGLAVYEALANAAEHAYPPDHHDPVIQLHAHFDADHVHITVSDHGSWIVPSDPGYRGYGFGLMRYLAHTVHVDPTPQGTTVHLSAPTRTTDHT
jgi:anti-sigma regulatory factor (Ser/Thr protein kinase)